MLLIFSEEFELMLKKFCLTLASVALTSSLSQAGIVTIDNFNSGTVYLNGPVPGTPAGATNVGCIYQNAQQVNSACGSIATATATPQTVVKAAQPVRQPQCMLHKFLLFLETIPHAEGMEMPEQRTTVQGMKVPSCPQEEDAAGRISRKCMSQSP